MLDIDAVIAALGRTIPRGRRPVALHEPAFAGREAEYLKDCLDTGWVSSMGQYVDRFESELASFVGTRRVVAVVNGTAALHASLKLVGVQPADEVLVPTLTFVATANAVAYCGAVPHFVDSEERTLGLDPRKLEGYLEEIGDVTDDGCRNRSTGARIKAVIAMHTFGHPVDLDPLVDVCRRHHVDLIEDAAESLGSFYKGRHTGRAGRIATLSFNGNKIITTGGGGAILTEDEELGRLAKHLTTTARLPHRWSYAHDQVGYNYRLPSINAALGCAQLQQLDGFLAAKRRLAESYRLAFEEVEDVRIFCEPPGARSNYWLNVLLLDPKVAQDRDRLLEATNDAGIGTRPVWTLMHALPMFQQSPRMDLSTAEDLARRVVNLPSSAVLGLDK